MRREGIRQLDVCGEPAVSVRGGLRNRIRSAGIGVAGEAAWRWASAACPPCHLQGPIAVG